jgi:ABC-2 type transport system permease protein
MLAVYLGLLAFFVLWIMAGALTQGLDNVWIAALVDPFGLRAMGRRARYWTTEERNTRLPPLLGFVLANRALWRARAGA